MAGLLWSIVVGKCVVIAKSRMTKQKRGGGYCANVVICLHGRIIVAFTINFVSRVLSSRSPH